VALSIIPRWFWPALLTPICARLDLTLMSAEYPAPTKSLSGHKRERSPNSSKSMSPSLRETRLGPSSKFPAKEHHIPHPPSKENDQRRYEPRGPSLSPPAMPQPTDSHLPRPISKEDSQSLSKSQERRHSPPAKVPNTKKAHSNSKLGNQGRQPSPSQGARYTHSMNTQGNSRSATSGETGRQSSIDTVEREADEQAEQMLRVTNELHRLNEIFDCYTTSSVGSEKYDPRARQIRSRVMVAPDIVDDLERELVYLNSYIWNNPQLPSRLRPSGPYSEDIKEILRTVPCLEERYHVLQQMLQSLQISSTSVQVRSDERTHKIRELKLILQDLGVELAEQDRHKEQQERQQEVTSNLTGGTGSMVKGPQASGRRRVHKFKPL
jgi:hypothetical protein